MNKITIKQVELVGADPGSFLDGQQVQFVENGKIAQVERLLNDDDEDIEPGDTAVLQNIEKQKADFKGLPDWTTAYGFSGKVTLDGKLTTAYETITRSACDMFVIVDGE